MRFKHKQKTDKESSFSRFCDKYLDLPERVADTDDKKVKMPNIFWLLFSLLGMVLAFLIGLTIKQKWFYTITFIGCFTVFAVVRYLRYKAKLANGSATAKIIDELNKATTEDLFPVSKKAIKNKVILTVFAALCLYSILEISYYTYFLLALTAALGLIYQSLFLKFNTVSMLNKELSAEKEGSVTDIVLKHTHNQKQKPIIFKSLIICAVSVMAAVALFVGLNLDSKYTTQNVDGGVKIVKYEPGLKELTKKVFIPKKLDGKTVVAIGKRAYSDNIYVKGFVLPQTILEIEEEAFSGCHGVESINLNNGLKIIGNGAFKDCKGLISITIPSSVTQIPDYAFYHCFSLETVKNWGSVTEIGAYAFSECDSLHSLQLPHGITKLSKGMFSCCDNLKTVTIPRSVTKIDKSVFYLCTSLNDMYIPDGVEEICKDAFGGCSALPEIYLPGDTAVEDNAFDSGITEIKLKLFTDQEKDAIDLELKKLEIPRIYILYKEKTGLEKPSYVYRNLAITVSHTSKVFQEYAEKEKNLGMIVIESPAEYLEFLRIMKEGGATQIHFNFESELAAQKMGEPYLVHYFLDIDEQIKKYELNPNKF